MNRIVILIACALPLGACNSSPQVNEKNASVAEVAQKVREATSSNAFVRPGKWASKVTIEQFSMPGMPPQMVERMKGMMAQNRQQNFESCLTEEQVKRPKEDFFTGKNDECRYDHFTMGGGKIDAEMHCGGASGGKQVMEMAGTYSPETYQMHMATKTDGGAGTSAGMSMQMRIDARRVGECTAKG